VQSSSGNRAAQSFAIVKVSYTCIITLVDSKRLEINTVAQVDARSWYLNRALAWVEQECRGRYHAIHPSVDSLFYYGKLALVVDA